MGLKTDRCPRCNLPKGYSKSGLARQRCKACENYYASIKRAKKRSKNRANLTKGD